MEHMGHFTCSGGLNTYIQSTGDSYLGRFAAAAENMALVKVWALIRSNGVTFF